jgi:hypothetical protein
MNDLLRKILNRSRKMMELLRTGSDMRWIVLPSLYYILNFKYYFAVYKFK